MSVQRVGIVVPARNEALLVRRCLGSILKASAESEVECFIVLVDDGSTDGTAAIASGMLSEHSGRVLSVSHGNVGAARAAGVEWLLENREAATTWIASTDADTVVPENWILGQLAHVEEGADAVAGLVDIDCGQAHPLRDAFAKAYGRKIAPTSHAHVHGANLSVSKLSYLSVGGFSPIPCGEDRDLWARLAAAGHRLVTDVHSVVITSSRLVSRTTGGFASDLRRLSAPQRGGASATGATSQGRA